MFWKKRTVTEEAPTPKASKLLGPIQIPALVAKYLVSDYKMDPDLVPLLKAVVHKHANGEKALDIRIFDEAEAMVKNVQVKDYTTLDKYPGLIMYQGWFDAESKRVKLEEKKALQSTTILTEGQILRKIEALTELGSSVFFYQARGPQWGGPLGRGAAIVELNPGYPGKRGKKYYVYTVNVDGLEPLDKGRRLFDSDKPKEIAKWVKESHQKRLY